MTAVVLLLLLSLVVGVECFRPAAPRRAVLASTARGAFLGSALGDVALSQASLLLSETTVSEEEILDVTGAASELPEPGLTISFAVFILLGTALLQFSLGDLTKEEGQARVRDFLATKKETERKRGYFD
jgi:hypothetical protein